MKRPTTGRKPRSDPQGGYDNDYHDMDEMAAGHDPPRGDADPHRGIGRGSDPVTRAGPVRPAVLQRWPAEPRRWPAQPRQQREPPDAAHQSAVEGVLVPARRVADTGRVAPVHGRSRRCDLL